MKVKVFFIVVVVFVLSVFTVSSQDFIAQPETSYEFEFNSLEEFLEFRENQIQERVEEFKLLTGREHIPVVTYEPIMRFDFDNLVQDELMEFVSRNVENFRKGADVNDLPVFFEDVPAHLREVVVSHAFESFLSGRELLVGFDVFEDVSVTSEEHLPSLETVPFAVNVLRVIPFRYTNDVVWYAENTSRTSSVLLTDGRAELWGSHSINGYHNILVGNHFQRIFFTIYPTLLASWSLSTFNFYEDYIFRDFVISR